MFNAFGKELQALTAALGFEKTQDLVGRADLLEQVQGNEQMNLEELLSTLPEQDITTIQPQIQEIKQAEAQLAVAVGAEYLDG
ncbi:hypothetical protein, partial [Pseudomonas sp. 2822-17]|uniref:hypothetical protein n=1 Tax=Pseudomonas sp. 2822-17 TaxID=1712678 RepID=UPI0015B1287D